MEETPEFQWIFDDEPLAPESVDAAQTVADTASFHPIPTPPPVVDFVPPVFTAVATDDATAQPTLAPLYPVAQPYLGVMNFPPVPEPPVNTAPRPTTIVLGFIVMALGMVAISLATGAAVDLGLVMVWLPAICGMALIAAAILAAVRRSKTS